jgi:hypothetical protein
VRRTTITAIARSLQRRGAIRYSRGRIQIVDREKLRKHACECYEAMRHVVDRDILKAAAPPIQAMLAHDILAEGTLPIARGEIRKRRD